MKKFLLSLSILIFTTALAACSVEITVSGKGYAPLTGYNIGDVRSREDKYMNEKAINSKTEFMHTQQIKEATRQAEKRKKQDKKMSGTVRAAVVTMAQENADKDAISLLTDRVLGAGASENPKVQEKFEDLYSQNGTYILDKTYTGEVIDNNYIAKVQMTVDETAFRELISDLGIAINTAAVRKSAILIVLDEFFAEPSDMKTNVLTKEVTTYKYDYDEKLKDTEKASAKSYSKSNASGASSNKYNVNTNSNSRYNAGASGGYSGVYGGGGYSGSYGGAYSGSYKGKGASSNNYKRSSSSGESASYGRFIDYGKKENEFFQNIKEYAPKAPVAQNLNYTQPALVNAFSTHDIRAIDNDIFKSKYFKGQYVTADKLSNSEVLANYVNYAKTDAKADFFAIGVSYITDNGINENTGKHTCDGNVFVKIYSTQDGEVIASGSLTETAAGNSPDQARAQVAAKIGNELGEVLSKKIQDFWKRRMMYGSEYVVELKGKFLPAERISINNALKSADGIKNVSLRTVEPTRVEYVLNYSGYA